MHHLLNMLGVALGTFVVSGTLLAVGSGLMLTTKERKDYETDKMIRIFSFLLALTAFLLFY